MKTVKLGDVCDIIGGGTPSKSVREYWGGDIRWASVRDMKFDVINETELKITSLGLKKSSSNLIPSGNVIIASRVGLGKVCWIDQPTAINQDLRAIVPRNKAVLDKKYLLWWLRSEAATIVGAGEGATVQGVRLTFLNALMIPLPSLKEQWRVVERLDAALEKIDRAIELTEENIKNVKGIFDSRLKNIYQKEHPDWESAKLGNLTTKIGSGATPKGGKSAYHAEGISLVRSLNVYDHYFKYDKLAHISDEQANKLSNVELEKDDVLLNITGASIARCSIVPVDCLPGRVNQHVSIIRLIKKKVLPEFLHYLLISEPYKKRLLGIGEGKGSTRQAITKAHIQEFTISFPMDIAQQEALVNELNVLMKHMSSLLQAYQHKLKLLSELKQSMLTQAFSQSEVE